jgi:hypothetical protein
MQLAKMLADHNSPLDHKLPLLRYAHDLQFEIDRRSIVAATMRPLSSLPEWEIRRSIARAIELDAMCRRERISTILAEHILALTQELDSRESAASSSRRRAARKKDQDS